MFSLCVALLACSILSPPPVRHSAAIPVRIALLSDTHITHGRGGTENSARFRRVVEDVNRADVSLVIFAGDLSNGGSESQFHDFLDIARGLKSPVLFSPGNPDIGNRAGLSDRGQVSEERIARYESVMGPSFYKAQVAGVRVVAVNTPLLGSHLPREEQQWVALNTWLSSRRSLPTLLLLHYPLFLNSPGEPDNPRFVVDPASRSRLINLAQRSGVKLIVGGHLHRGVVRTTSGIQYITSPAVGCSSDHDSRPAGWTLLTWQPDGAWRVEFRTEAARNEPGSLRPRRPEAPSE